MAEFIKTKRHLDYYCASQQLNNLYMKNKNSKKIKYMFGDEESYKDNNSLTLSRLRKSKLANSFFKEKNKNYDAIRQMKDIFYSFYTTNTGISNALIFLDEKRNIINNLDFYNYNPWKADWIFTRKYKKERCDMIQLIREEMDYKGEVSDDEDSIIKYDETQDQLNEQIRKFNRRSIAFEQRPNIKNEDKPIINNEEINTGQIKDDNDEDDFDDDELSHKILKEFDKIKTVKSIYSQSEKGKRIFNGNKNNVMIKNDKNMRNYFPNTESENNLIQNKNLNVEQDVLKNLGKNK